MNVLVSGAGIAGLALAHWLRRHGIACTIVERAPAPRTGGQAIDIRGAARDVVERMGIMDDIRTHHTGAHGLAYVDARGRRVAEMGGDGFGDSGGVIAEIEILRGDLLRILGTAAAGTDVVYDDMITGLTETPEGIRAEFRHGPLRTFDAVVGADGLRSGVRAHAFGPESAHVRDLGTYTAYFPARTTLDLDGWELMYNAPGGRVCLLYPVGRDGAVRVLLAFRSPVRDVSDPPAVLREVFADAGWELPGLLPQIPTDLYFARDGFVQVDGWSRGGPSCSGTRRSAARSGWARAWRWSGRTSWPASWPPPATRPRAAATRPRRSGATRSSCATTSPSTRSATRTSTRASRR